MISTIRKTYKSATINTKLGSDSQERERVAEPSYLTDSEGDLMVDSDGYQLMVKR